MTDYCLVDGEVLLMSDYSPQSFDARCFGVQFATGIKGVASPVCIFD